MLIRVNNVQFTTSGTFAGNTNYIVTDGISTLTVRIDADTDIPGMTIPSGPVSIIGILGQYGTTYQLLPRSRADIIPLSVAENPENPVSPFEVKGRTLILNGKAKVYSVDGRLIFEGEGKISLGKGVYMVKTDKIVKVIIR
jgi:hypothetical protein